MVEPATCVGLIRLIFKLTLNEKEKMLSIYTIGFVYPTDAPLLCCVDYLMIVTMDFNSGEN